MNVQKLINKLELKPLNTMLVQALLENEELRQKVSLVKNKRYDVLTIKTKHIQPHMFYFGVENGFYVLNTKFGPMKTWYTKAEYLQWQEENKFLTVVAIKKRVVFGVFHKEPIVAHLFCLIASFVAKDRDSQRKKLYKWQHLYDATTTPLHEELTWQKTHALVFRVLHDYGFDLERVRISNAWNQRNKKAIARHSLVYESRLDLSTAMLWLYEFGNTTIGTVLHELAHSVVLTEYCSWKGPVAGHGPEYCLILAELFNRYADIPFEHTYNSMRKARLKLPPVEDFFDGKKFPLYEGML